MTIEQRLYEGDLAKEVLENPAFNAAFDAIKQELMEAWESSPKRDAEGREEIFRYLTVLKKLKLQLEKTLDSGKLAKAELDHRRTLQERARDLIFPL